MPRIVVVEITPEDIAAGGTSCSDCPVAHAMARAGFDLPRVSLGTISWFGNCGREFIPTPESVADFIDTHDFSFDGQPFAFEVDCDLAVVSSIIEPAAFGGEVELP